MSELTPCNRCTLNTIIDRHPAAAIELRPDEHGWTACYLDGRLVASFAALTDDCVC